ncbi:hypothetical protein [Stratiformator vulcanicus]|uniref:hypothetical protein n=1 Tax=Stratiformator vulcanicus TaxID=2527980 RepID=UPI0028778B5D|nr:hypothetical protein [Stratiformator vulcanicus]
MDKPESSIETEIGQLRRRGPVEWIVTSPGRAVQQNAAAASSHSTFLLFLHADARLSDDGFERLLQCLRSDRAAVWYFHLKFAADGPSANRLNAAGANFRSRWLGLPFGDQGLCLSRKSFEQLGRFDETAPYGEDHLLVWSAHRAALPVRAVPSTIETSARRYQDQGWLRTTTRHVSLTIRQALPEYAKLIARRVRTFRGESGHGE